MNAEKVLPNKYTVELGGRTLELRFRTRAIMAAQKKLKGQDFFTGISTGDMESFITCLWAALLVNDPAPTFEEVDKWCDDIPLADLNDRIAEPLGKAISEGTETPEDDTKKKKAKKKKR